MPESAAEKFAREQFERERSDLEMRVLHDEGLYRHLRFQRPDTRMYSYDLITWPGHLSITGDIDGGYTFARIDDMVRFFASGSGINPGYWAEKITNSGARESTRRYSEDRFRAAVEQAFEDAGLDEDPDREAKIRAAWAEHIEFNDDLHFEEGAQIAIRDFGPVEGFQFYDFWERDLRDWHHHYLLCCFAIRAGVDTYLEAQPQPAGVPV